LSHSIPSSSAALSDQAVRVLVCPRCRNGLTTNGTELSCQNLDCTFRGAIRQDVVLLGDPSGLSFFDDKHDVMAAGNLRGGVRCLCYDRQASVVESLLRSGIQVLDVGCGPTLPYQKPADTFVIGLEASYESIRVNREVDMRVYGTAAEIPLPDDSVDAVLAYYAVHHMTGQTTDMNRRTIMRVFKEFGRVVKPGGELLVFEVSPWRPFYRAETLIWNQAKAVLGERLDMFFYSARDYETLGRVTLPGTTFSVQSFGSSMLSIFPPVFSLPWLRIPRFLYPFDVNLYRWRFDTGNRN
jgi:ubiquinone/menaquinone biosynthesis C-methylase UbiE